MSARSRDARRFYDLDATMDSIWLSMGNPNPAEKMRRTARMRLADMTAEQQAELAEPKGPRSCA